jgi:hypothetical protein
MKTLGTLHPTEIVSSPDVVQQAVLAAGTGQAFDVPTGGAYCLFSSNVDLWVRYGSTAASIPTTSSTGSSTNAELNPTARNIGSTLGCTGISIISASSGYATMAWYTR